MPPRRLAARSSPALRRMTVACPERIPAWQTAITGFSRGTCGPHTLWRPASPASPASPFASAKASTLAAIKAPVGRSVVIARAMHRSPHQLRLRLLGKPLLTLDGHAIPVGSRKALALLAVLALEGASSRARLAALLWPDQEDASARRNLRREVFRLRNVGVDIDDDAQSLTIGTSIVTDCDVLDAQAPPSTGILLDGFDRLANGEFSDWLSNWRVRLAQRNSIGATQAAAQLEQRGDMRAALELHLAQLAIDSTNETAAQHALRLHGRLGERDAALALFARLESQLHQQLGLAPLPATREIVQQLRGPNTAAAGPTPPDAVSGVRVSPLPALIPFAGRASERQAIEAAWKAGRIVYVAGPPGVGKSRLARECASLHGAALFIRCRPDDTQLPYSSAVRALRVLLEAAPDVELPAWATRELARLLPELGPSTAAGPAANISEAFDEALMRLLEAYAHAWLQLAEQNFNVIVLDDWQFADAASLKLWSFVEARSDANAGDCTSRAVRRLVAFRSGELAPQSLDHLRRQLDGGRAMLFSLDGLQQADVQALVQQLAGQSGATLFAQRLHTATEGNPLFVLETIRHLFEQELLSIDPAGGWRTPYDSVTSDYNELPVAPSARATIVARVRALGDGAARLLEAASLAGDAFDLAQLSGTAALDDTDSVAALELAQSAQILRIDQDGLYRFAHDLYRQCVADSLSPARRALVHGRLARNLVSAGGASARVADHFEKANLLRDAAPWYVRAADAAAEVYDHDTALAHYARALRLGLDAGAAYSVHDRRLMLLHRLYRVDEQLSELNAMAELAKSLDDKAAPFELASRRASTLINSGRVDDALALASWVAKDAPTLKLKVRARYLVGCAWMLLGDHISAAQHLRAALVDAPTEFPACEQMIYVFLCHIAISAGALDVAQEHYERGLRAAELSSGTLTRADMQNAGYRIAEASGQRPEAIRRLEEANGYAIGTGDVNSRINVLFNLVAVLLNGGEPGAARLRRDDLVVLLAGKFDPKAQFFEHFTAGRLAVCEGDLGAAWTSLQAAVEAAGASGDTSMQRAAHLALAHLAVDCDHIAVLIGDIGLLTTLGPHREGELTVIEEALAAHVELAAGNVRAARDRLERTCGTCADSSLSPDPDWQENHEFARAMLAAARLADGDPHIARDALAEIRFSPRLMAIAAQIRLDIGVAMQTIDADHVDDAARLLATHTVPPLRAVRLWRALADAYALSGEAALSQQADFECRRLADSLTASIPATPAFAALRQSLNRRFGRLDRQAQAVFNGH